MDQKIASVPSGLPPKLPRSPSFLNSAHLNSPRSNALNSPTAKSLNSPTSKNIPISKSTKNRLKLLRSISPDVLNDSQNSFNSPQKIKQDSSYEGLIMRVDSLTSDVTKRDDDLAEIRRRIERCNIGIENLASTGLKKTEKYHDSHLRAKISFRKHKVLSKFLDN